MKGEESAEAKIKSFDEVISKFVLKSCRPVLSTSGLTRHLLRKVDLPLSPDSPEVQIHGEQSRLPEKKAESSG